MLGNTPEGMLRRMRLDILMRNTLGSTLFWGAVTDVTDQYR